MPESHGPTVIFMSVASCFLALILFVHDKICNCDTELNVIAIAATVFFFAMSVFKLVQYEEKAIYTGTCIKKENSANMIHSATVTETIDVLVAQIKETEASLAQLHLQISDLSAEFCFRQNEQQRPDQVALPPKPRVWPVPPQTCRPSSDQYRDEDRIYSFHDDHNTYRPLYTHRIIPDGFRRSNDALISRMNMPHYSSVHTSREAEKSHWSSIENSPGGFGSDSSSTMQRRKSFVNPNGSSGRGQHDFYGVDRNSRSSRSGSHESSPAKEGVRHANRANPALDARSREAAAQEASQKTRACASLRDSCSWQTQLNDPVQRHQNLNQYDERQRHVHGGTHQGNQPEDSREAKRGDRLQSVAQSQTLKQAHETHQSVDGSAADTKRKPHLKQSRDAIPRRLRVGRALSTIEEEDLDMLDDVRYLCPKNVSLAKHPFDRSVQKITSRRVLSDDCENASATALQHEGRSAKIKQAKHASSNKFPGTSSKLSSMSLREATSEERQRNHQQPSSPLREQTWTPVSQKDIKASVKGDDKLPAYDIRGQMEPCRNRASQNHINSAEVSQSIKYKSIPLQERTKPNLLEVKIGKTKFESHRDVLPSKDLGRVHKESKFVKQDERQTTAQRYDHDVPKDLLERQGSVTCNTQDLNDDRRKQPESFWKHGRQQVVNQGERAQSDGKREEEVIIKATINFLRADTLPTLEHQDPLHTSNDTSRRRQPPDAAALPKRRYWNDKFEWRTMTYEEAEAALDEMLADLERVSPFPYEENLIPKWTEEV